MKEKVEQIRALLDDLERETAEVDQAQEYHRFSGSELIDVVCDVVDYLMPEIKPYELALYLHFLRHSVIEGGKPYIRASVRGLQSGIIKSAYAGSTSGGGGEVSSTSYKQVKNSIDGLITMGALRQEGEATRDGTLYRVMLPEEIDACNARREQEAKLSIKVATEREADFYNVRENRAKIYERDGYKCGYCGKQLTRFTATLDHITPVHAGGDNSADNLKTACLQCNSKKTGRPLGDFLAER